MASLISAGVAMTLVCGFIGRVALRRELPFVKVFSMMGVLWLAGMFAVWAIASNRRAHRVKSEINPTYVRPVAIIREEPNLSESNG